MRKSIALLSLLAFGSACSFMARGPEDYKKDTRAVLETKNSAIKACYDNALASDPAMSGTVVVNFTVEKKTGTLTNIAVNPDESTAPQPLQDCVASSLDGLKLTPEDRRDGQASFTWIFSANPSA